MNCPKCNKTMRAVTELSRPSATERYASHSVVTGWQCSPIAGCATWVEKPFEPVIQGIPQPKYSPKELRIDEERKAERKKNHHRKLQKNVDMKNAIRTQIKRILTWRDAGVPWTNIVQQLGLDCAANTFARHFNRR